MSANTKLTMVGLEPTIQLSKDWMAGSMPGHGEDMRGSVPKRL